MLTLAVSTLTLMPIFLVASYTQADMPGDFENEQPTNPTLSPEPSSKSDQIAVTSPDFGGPFTNIGQYVVAVLTKIIPLIIAGAVLVIVFAGFRYITSLGNPDAVSQARSLIEGAVLGIITLLLIGLIWAILIDTKSATNRERPNPQPVKQTLSH